MLANLTISTGTRVSAQYQMPEHRSGSSAPLTPIFKSCPKNSISNYRPISVLSKIRENLMVTRLYNSIYVYLFSSLCSIISHRIRLPTWQVNVHGLIGDANMQKRSHEL